MVNQSSNWESLFSDYEQVSVSADATECGDQDGYIWNSQWDKIAKLRRYDVRIWSPKGKLILLCAIEERFITKKVI